MYKAPFFKTLIYPNQHVKFEKHFIGDSDAQLQRDFFPAVGKLTDHAHCAGQSSVRVQANAGPPGFPGLH